LKGTETWLLEIDYQLVMDAMKQLSTGEEETPEEKTEKIKQWVKEKKHGSA